MSFHIIDDYKLKKLLFFLKKENLLPKNIELSNIGRISIATVYEKKDSNIMSNTACTGFSKSPQRATLKALTEFIERKAYLNGHSSGLKGCDTDSSDGFAGYPVILTTRKRARRSARINFLNEAIERYAWSCWWDNADIDIL